MNRVFSVVSEAYAARDTPDTSTQDLTAIYRQEQPSDDRHSQHAGLASVFSTFIRNAGSAIIDIRYHNSEYVC